MLVYFFQLHYIVYQIYGASTPTSQVNKGNIGIEKLNCCKHLCKQAAQMAACFVSYHYGLKIPVTLQ